MNPILKHRRAHIDKVLTLTNRKFAFDFVKRDYAVYALSNGRDKLKSHLIKILRPEYNLMKKIEDEAVNRSYLKLFT